MNQKVISQQATLNLVRRQSGLNNGAQNALFSHTFQSVWHPELSLNLSLREMSCLSYRVTSQSLPPKFTHVSWKGLIICEKSILWISLPCYFKKTEITSFHTGSVMSLAAGHAGTCCPSQLLKHSRFCLARSDTIAGSETKTVVDRWLTWMVHVYSVSSSSLTVQLYSRSRFLMLPLMNRLNIFSVNRCSAS